MMSKRSLTKSLTTPAARPDRIFGFQVSPLDAAAIAERVAAECRTPSQGVGLVVTANIDHVHRLRHDATFRAAYDGAEIVTCDGFPVYRYARLRGAAAPARVTGCDIAALLMRPGALNPAHRPFFVVDSAETVHRVQRWAAREGLPIATAVPPFGFETNAAARARLAAEIAAHGTTLLLMGVGAPKSEVFVEQERARLPPCWAVCVGQAMRYEAGLSTRAPRLMQRLDLEWAWRLAHEPRRLTGRYVSAGFGFIGAVFEDLAREQASGSFLKKRTKKLLSA